MKNEMSLPLVDFTGTYVNELYGQINVNLENEKLIMKVSNHPDLIGKLEHIENDNFLCTFSIPWFGVREIPFDVENNEVRNLTLRIPILESAPYVFNKEN